MSPSGGCCCDHDGMSVSLYYGASRATALTTAEQQALGEVLAGSDPLRFTLPRHDGESFEFYDEPSGSELLSGSVKPPTDPDAAVEALAHWARTLLALQAAVPSLNWRIHLDDLDLDDAMLRELAAAS